MIRIFYVLLTSAASLGAAISASVSVPVTFIWNVSASAPIGLYLIEPLDKIDVTDLVAVVPPASVAAFMIERGYLFNGTLLLKRVMALPGQKVCRSGNVVSVDAVPLGEALDRDRIGRPLPVWQGCRRLANDQLFLMNLSATDSLDGRYFGPLPATTLIGKATPLYTDEDGDGRFVWWAATR